MKRNLAVLILVLAVAASGVLMGSCQSAQPTVATEPTKAPTSAPVATTAPTALPTAVPTTGPKSGGTVKIIVGNLPPSYGNIKDKGWNATSVGYCFPILETLVGATKDGLVPSKLATSWDVAKDGSSITFKLRQGVKFHDGTDFNAEAVKWNVEQIMPHKSELKVISSIDVVDAHTVRFNLSEYSNTLLYHFAWYDGAMISPASVEGRDAEYIATHLVGTGPFELVSFQKDTSAVFKKFEGYWDEGKPYLDGMEYVVVKDTNTARSALLSGQVNAWDYVTSKNAADAKAQGYNVNTCPGLIRIAYTDSANPNSPFAKKEVRYALEYAIDKQALVDTFGGGTWAAPLAPCSSAIHTGCSVITDGRSYDPAKAKQLLAEAGYPQGFNMTMYSQAATDPELLAAIQGYLRAAGIVAELKIVDATTMAGLRTKGWENGMLVQGISTANGSLIQALQTDGPSPTKAYSALRSSEYSDLLKQAAAATDPAAEKAFSEQLAKLVQDEAVILPFVIESRNAVYDKTVHLDLNAFSIWFWNPGDTWIE